MLKICLAFAAIASVAMIPTASVAQTFPQDIPMGIICWSQNAKTWVVGYIHTVKENGEAVYQGQGGRLNATLNAARVIATPSDRPAGLDCFGKTLDQLRAMGRLIPLQRVPTSPQ
ncbi:hypothetical protein JQ599_24355 [Bradyrhizobium diazoefficiens]|jgi:hypothetical protein|uniref:hypothetical protein n=1 Tax=Bradyrhizobium sp. A11 TaxID=3133974 RepID=UPI001B8A794F|nr:hypothetical protein [Bradyrhizobium diazoefficiens]MBR0703060.1 hypothetical protein [Bradyrhizobium diazoefficiens]MBR0771815.1 hypothetical protein [Bradyrhizobium diazoefficiens]